MTIGKRILTLTAFLVAALLAPAVSHAQCDAPTVCIPQPTCAYAGPGVVVYPPTSMALRNLALRNPSHCEPPPSPGAISDSFFDIFYDFEISYDSGGTWHPRSGSTTGTIRMMSPAPGAPIELELLALELVDVVGGFRLRECPSRPSHGREAAAPNAGGFHIDSFFDVFTELSLDGGQSWVDAPQSDHLEIGPGSPTPARSSSWGTVKAIYR